MPARPFSHTMLVAALALAVPQAAARASEAACDGECLTGALNQLVDELRSGDAAATILSADAELRQDGDVTAFDSTIWRQVRAVRSSMAFADPLTGNALVRSGVELADGRPAYVSTRIRRSATGRIVAVEIAQDSGPMVRADYVFYLDPLYTTPVPETRRTSGSAMEAIVRRYFNSLGTHVATPDDIDNAACNRFHSGTQITNVRSPGMAEEGAMLTCLSALEGSPPWGPASEQRVPLIDVEHGVALGITLLHYPREEGDPVMYVTEVFKIIDGRIVSIDNIGLKGAHRDTLGFVN